MSSYSFWKKSRRKRLWQLQPRKYPNYMLLSDPRLDYDTLSTNHITGPEHTGTTQGALAPMGGANQSSSASQSTQNGLAVGPHTGPLPLAPSSVLPARPNLPDDPVIPHNGFTTIEEAEKAFMHLLRKAGVDANWTWDQTMRAIITDPLYKALNTLAEKKACWEKVSI